MLMRPHPFVRHLWSCFVLYCPSRKAAMLAAQHLACIDSRSQYSGWNPMPLNGSCTSKHYRCLYNFTVVAHRSISGLEQSDSNMAWPPFLHVVNFVLQFALEQSGSERDSRFSQTRLARLTPLLSKYRTTLLKRIGLKGAAPWILDPNIIHIWAFWVTLLGGLAALQVACS